MSILTFEVKSNRKQRRFMLQWAKYRFLEVGLNVLIRCIPNITLRVRIGIYKQTDKETGQFKNRPCFRSPNSKGTGKVCGSL